VPLVKDELLDDDPGKRGGDLEADLLLRLEGEGVEHPVQRVLRVGGVQRGDHEMARLGGVEGQPHDLRFPQFPDDDHVRVLPQDVREPLFEGRHVRAQFALLDEGLFRDEPVLDGVLEGDDVGGPAAVDLVNDRGDRRRLAGSRGPADEHEPGPQLRDLLQGRVEVEALDRGDDAREKADGEAQAARRAEDIEAQPNMLNRDREIDGPIPAQDLHLPRREKLPDQPVHLGMGPLDGAVLLDLAVLPKHHRVGARDVNVRNPLADGCSDDAAELLHHVSLWAGVIRDGLHPGARPEKDPQRKLSSRIRRSLNRARADRQAGRLRAPSKAPGRHPYRFFLISERITTCLRSSSMTCSSRPWAEAVTYFFISE